MISNASRKKVGNQPDRGSGELQDEKSPKIRGNELALELEIRRAETEKLLIVWKAVIDYAQNAVRAVILANGAAATAVLTYAGTPGNTSISWLKFSAVIFAFGTSCGVLGSVLAYLSQYEVVKNAVKNDHKVVLAEGKKRRWAIVSVFTGLIAFLAGVTIAALR